MQLTDPAADGATPDARTFQRLDRRLTPDAEAPVAVALSGGGDSVALLLIAARWARARGRRLLALTVDHGLQPESAAWSRFAAEAAAAAGADWRGLTWDGRKPASGLTAAARAARHGLIADAARSAGARVVLFGHTADDIAEADWMRRQGATLGRLREWSPSPAWPEGRGLMLLRPLLAERRAGLRDWLAARRAAWIEDPANADARFGRSRARKLRRAGANLLAGRALQLHMLPFAWPEYRDAWMIVLVPLLRCHTTVGTPSPPTATAGRVASGPLDGVTSAGVLHVPPTNRAACTT